MGNSQTSLLDSKKQLISKEQPVSKERINSKEQLDLEGQMEQIDDCEFIRLMFITHDIKYT